MVANIRTIHMNMTEAGGEGDDPVYGVACYLHPPPHLTGGELEVWLRMKLANVERAINDIKFEFAVEGGED